MIRAGRLLAQAVIVLALLSGCPRPTQKPLAIILWPGDSGIVEQVAAAGYRPLVVGLPCQGNLSCWAGERMHMDAWIADLDATIKANGGEAVVVGISRGGYLALRAGSELDSVTKVVALSPVTDLARLREFDGRKVVDRLAVGKLARKPVFIAIGRDDTRVSTEGAVTLFWNLRAGRLLVTDAPGHTLTGVTEAMEWARP